LLRSQNALRPFTPGDPSAWPNLHVFHQTSTEKHHQNITAMLSPCQAHQGGSIALRIVDFEPVVVEITKRAPGTAETEEKHKPT